MSRKRGFAYPPADGTHDREVMDRFTDFLRTVGPAATPNDIAEGRTRHRGPAERYRVKFLMWRVGSVSGGVTHRRTEQRHYTIPGAS